MITNYLRPDLETFFNYKALYLAFVKSLGLHQVLRTHDQH